MPVALKLTPAESMMRAQRAPNDIGHFIDSLLTISPQLRAIWRVGQGANGKAGPSLFVWDLIAYGNPQVLQQLRQAVHLHRENVRLRVVTDGDRFQSAWGIEQNGSLARWEWAQTSPGEAYYNDFAAQTEHRNRVRYRAVRLWHAGPDPAAAPSELEATGNVG